MAALNYAKIIVDEGGNSLIFFNGDKCLYRCDRTNGKVKYLKCIAPECPARAKLVEGGLFELTRDSPHNHANDHKVRVEYESAYENLRAMVRDKPSRSIRDLHRDVLRGLSLDAASYLNWENCRLTLQRIRNRLMPPCRSLAELEKYLENSQGAIFEQFGLLDEKAFYVGSANGQLMFGNLNIVDQLPDLIELFVDGTFGITPFKTRQLLVVLAELQGNPRPIFYALMSSQTTDDYAAIFIFLRDILFGVNQAVLSVTSDFEQAIRAAVRKVWPQADVNGCNFHLCQAVEKNAKNKPGLAGGKLAAGTIHRKIIIMFMRLSLLPLERINAGFVSLLDYIQEKGSDDDDFEPSDFDDFIEYFNQTWFVRFPPATWCASDKDRRTNNNAEGHNRKIKDTIDDNPSPWDFLHGLRDLMLDASAKLKRDQRNNAQTPVSQSRLNAPLEAALKQLAEGEIDELKFLKIMAAS